jgi:hypothetical protein
MHLQVFADSDDSIRARGNYKQLQVQPLLAVCAEVISLLQINGELFPAFILAKSHPPFPLGPTSLSLHPRHPDNAQMYSSSYPPFSRFKGAFL